MFALRMYTFIMLRRLRSGCGRSRPDCFKVKVKLLLNAR